MDFYNPFSSYETFTRFFLALPCLILPMRDDVNTYARIRYGIGA